MFPDAYTLGSDAAPYEFTISALSNTRSERMIADDILLGTPNGSVKNKQQHIKSN